MDTETPTVSGGTPPTPETSKSPNKKRRLIIGGISGLAALAIAVPTFLAIESSSDNAKTPPKGTETSAPATPNATPTPSSAETLTVASLEIPSTMAPEQVGKTLMQDRYNAWIMAGANDATFQERVAFSEDNKSAAEVNGDFVYKKAAEYGPIFSEALFIPGYENNASLLAEARGTQKNNASSLESYIITHNDPDTYKYFSTVESTTVVSQSTDTLILKIDGTEHNNAAQNRIGTQYDPGAINIDGNRFEAAVTLKSINGSYKIAQIGITNLGK